MPIFEYRCTRCGTVSEFLVGVAREAEKLECSSCGSPRLEKVFSPVSFAVRSSGEACRSCPAHERATTRRECQESGCPRAL